jgi:NAD(P)-dependent dehydrogenase (short-subunit alcohol dehydrogenase family)
MEEIIMNKRIALVTGASSGIGKETAIELHNKGFIVYAAARRLDKMQDLKTKGILPISLDITSDESMVNCVNEILKNEGRIDVLVNNAGYGSYGAIEDVPMEEARRQIEVNLFGLARMVQLVLPSMRKNRYGKIVNISSMGGKIWTSFGGWYHAAKFAVEGFSDCLRLEVAPFGIDVIVVEPGGIKTDWGIIAAQNLKKASAGGAYADAASKTADGMIKNYTGNNLSKPELIARTIGKAVTTSKPKTRYLVGFMAKPMVFIKTAFGDRIYDRIIKMFS